MTPRINKDKHKTIAMQSTTPLDYVDKALRPEFRGKRWCRYAAMGTGVEVLGDLSGSQRLGSLPTHLLFWLCRGGSVKSFLGMLAILALVPGVPMVVFGIPWMKRKMAERQARNAHAIRMDFKNKSGSCRVSPVDGSTQCSYTTTTGSKQNTRTITHWVTIRTEPELEKFIRERHMDPKYVIYLISVGVALLFVGIALGLYKLVAKMRTLTPAANMVSIGADVLN